MRATPYENETATPTRLVHAGSRPLATVQCLKRCRSEAKGFISLTGLIPQAATSFPSPRVMEAIQHRNYDTRQPQAAGMTRTEYNHSPQPAFNQRCIRIC